MKKDIKIRWIIGVGVLLIFVVVLANPIYNLIVNQEQWSRKELSDYKNIFDADAQKKLSLFNTIESKTREPESQYIYSNKFNVFVTKFRIPNNFNIRESIQIRSQVFNVLKSELYFPLRSYNCKIIVKSERIPLINGIILDINGEIHREINRNRKLT